MTTPIQLKGKKICKLETRALRRKSVWGKENLRPFYTTPIQLKGKKICKLETRALRRKSVWGKENLRPFYTTPIQLKGKKICKLETRALRRKSVWGKENLRPFYTTPIQLKGKKICKLETRALRRKSVWGKENLRPFYYVISKNSYRARWEKLAVFLFLCQYDLTLVLEVFLEIFLRERESEPRSGEEREKPLVTLASNLAQEKPLGPG